MVLDFIGELIPQGVELALVVVGLVRAPEVSVGPQDATKGIIASWAVGVAMQVADVTAPNYDQQVMQYARMALEARRQMKNEVEP